MRGREGERDMCARASACVSWAWLCVCVCLSESERDVCVHARVCCGHGANK